jgi:hypothetical protein
MVRNGNDRRFLMQGSSKHNAFRLASLAKIGRAILNLTGSTDYLNQRKARMTNPCRTCDLYASDKNNPTCIKCSKRILYVSTIDRDLCFTSCRSNLEASAPRFAIISRQAQFVAGSPEVHYE